MRSKVPLVMLFLGLIISVGCGGAGCEDRPDRDRITPAEYFNQTQGNTITPNGRIIGGSAEPAGSGKVRYRTEDGKRWEATVTPDGQGYRYRDTRAVE